MVERPAPPPAARPGPGDGQVRAVVDLTLGAWLSREAATQLAAALGVALGPGLCDTSDDDDSAGDPLAFLSHDDARRIAAALPPTGAILVLAPRHGQGIGTLNDWLFHFLRRRASQLTLIGSEPATAMARGAFETADPSAAPPPGKPIGTFPPEQQRILRFFPGLLPKPLATTLGIAPAEAGLMPVGDGYFLIPPAYRDTDPASAATTLDAMEPVEALDDGFRALAQSFCTAHFADSATLAGLAARAFRCGEIELARTLSARARTVARTPEAAAGADVIRQEIRLHQGRIAEILATPDPSRRASAALRDRLARLRLRAEIERGERDAPPAAVAGLMARLEAGEASGEDIDLLGRHVVARARLGEAADMVPVAAALESAADAGGDRRLMIATRRHRITLARVSGDTAGERRGLGRLAAATAGTRTLAEIVAMNVELARLEPDQASPEARGAWLRAAFAWLAYEPFEAFPAELVEVVLGTASLPRPQVDDAVSERLAGGLAAGGAGPASEGGELLPAVHFRPHRPTVPERLAGGPGVAILWARKLDWAAPSPFRQRLLSAAWAAFRQAYPASELREGTIIVDDDLGNDLPATREAALAQALRLGVADVRFGDERITIDAALQRRLAADLRIGLSPAVAAVSGPPEAPRITFGRRLPDVALEGRDAEAVAAMNENGRMPLGTLAVLLGLPLSETEQAVRGLERRRIVRIDMAARPPAPVSPGPSPESRSSSASA